MGQVPDRKSKRFVRCRCNKVTEIEELIMDPKLVNNVVYVVDQKVLAIEKALVSNLPA
jgi:hypothetical protein